MKKNLEQKILIASVAFIIFVICLNIYSINVLRLEVHENFYKEEAVLLVEGIERLFIDKSKNQLEELANDKAIISSLKREAYSELRSYMDSIDRYIEYDFFAIYSPDKELIYSNSKDKTTQNSIIEAYKGLYNDELDEGIIEIPLIDENKSHSNFYLKKNIEDESQVIGSIIIGLASNDIINYMNTFDEESFILNPSGQIYLSSHMPSEHFKAFLRKNNQADLDKEGEKLYKDFYFEVFSLDESPWKMIVLQNFDELKLSSRISKMIISSYIFAFISLVLLIILVKKYNRSYQSKRQLETLTNALKETETNISIINSDSEIIYSNHREFDLIYQNPDNNYFKSDILGAIRKNINYEKEYSFKINGNRKWFIMHLNMLNIVDNCSCAVVTLNEFTNEKLYRKKLENLASFDKLTGCYNRSQGIDKLNEDIKDRNEVKEISLIFLDIDDLKYVNDNMGHSRGDTLIKSTISSIKDYIRSDDYSIRLGGDEFLIVLLNCSYTRASDIILKAQNQIENINILNENDKYRVSFSFGIVSRENTKDIDIEAMINEADAKMYINKRLKKNKRINKDLLK